MSSPQELRRQKAEKEDLITVHQRRLQKREQQAAAFGLDTPPHIIMEIEDIESQIEKLQTELKTIEQDIMIAINIETSQSLVGQASENRDLVPPQQKVDPWGVASVKSRLHALSEIVAQDAMREATIGAEKYPYDALTMLVPLFVDLRWSRGYRSGLTRLLKIPPRQKHLKDFHCEEVSPPCPVMDGLLSAEQEGSGRVLIQLAGNPAALVSNLSSAEIRIVVDSVENYGRLGVPSTGGLSLLERIGEIPIYSETEDLSEVSAALFRNREALIPLVARLGMPGGELLLPHEEEFPPIGRPLLEDPLQEEDKRENRRWRQLEQSQQEGLEAKVFLARRAIRR